MFVLSSYVLIGSAMKIYYQNVDYDVETDSEQFGLKSCQNMISVITVY